MANIRLSEIVLYDRFPGPVNPHLGIPTSGWEGVDHSGITTPAYPVGTKIMAYTDNTHCPGTYTMYYGNLAGISSVNYGISKDFSDGLFWCAHCCLTVDADDDLTYSIAINDGTYCPAYVLHECDTNASTDCTNGGQCCVPCATLDPYEYGWFWVGGVCPVKDATIMADDQYTSSEGGIGVDITTAGDVRAGAVWLICQTTDEVALTGSFCEAVGITDSGAVAGGIRPQPWAWAMGVDD